MSWQDTALARFLVEHEKDGEGTMRQDWFQRKGLAVAFAVRITRDGTAWPSEARISREIRDSRFAEWRPDRAIAPLDVIGGHLV